MAPNIDPRLNLRWTWYSYWTDSGEQPAGAPIRLQPVLAALDRVLGIEPATTLADFNGRP